MSVRSSPPHGVRPGCPDRGLDDPDAVGSKDGVEGGCELGVAVTDKELDGVRLVGELHREVASLLGHPVSGRLGGHAGNPHQARVVVDEHEDVQPAEKDGVDVEEVARRQSLGLCGEELCPGRSRSPRRRLDAVVIQDRPDAGGGDHNAYGGKFSLDPPVAPGGDLLRQSEDERGSSLRNGWPSRVAVWVGPAPLHELPVPAQQGLPVGQRGARDDDGGAVVPVPANTARSVGCSAGRRTCRRRTASSWRSTTTSMARSV